MATMYELTAKLVLDSSQYLSDLKKAQRETTAFEGAVQDAAGAAGELDGSSAAAALSVDDFGSMVTGATTAAEKHELAVGSDTKAIQDNGSVANDGAGNFKKLAEQISGCASKLEFLTWAAAAAKAALKFGQVLANNAVEVSAYGDSIDKTAQKLQMSAKGYQEWAYILEHAGADGSALQAAMRTLADKANDSADAFKELGINVAEIETLDAEGRFNRVIRSLMDMDDEARRSAIASELLGRSYMDFMPVLNMTGREADQLAATMHRLGGVMSDEQVKMSADLQDAITDYKTALQGFRNEWAKYVTPIATDVVNLGAGILGFVDTTMSGGIIKAAENAVVGWLSPYIGLIQGLEDEAAKAVQDTTQDAIAADEQAQAAMQQNLEALAHAYDETYGQIRQTVNGFFGAFQGDINIAEHSVGEMRDSLQEQFAVLNDYDGNMKIISQWAEKAGIDFTEAGKSISDLGIEGAGFAKAIVDELAKGDEGAESVREMLEQLSAVNSMKESLSETLTGVSGGFDKMAKEAGLSIDDVRKQWENLRGVADIEKKFIVTYEGGGDVGGSFAGGISYVPEHMIAMIHEGERVLTKEENKALSAGRNPDSGESFGGVSIVQNINAVPQTPAELAAATEAYFEQARWMK